MYITLPADALASNGPDHQQVVLNTLAHLNCHCHFVIGDFTTDGLVQRCSNYIANAMELLRFCTKSSICFHWSTFCSVKTMTLQQCCVTACRNLNHLHRCCIVKVIIPFNVDRDLIYLISCNTSLIDAVAKTTPCKHIYLSTWALTCFLVVFPTTVIFMYETGDFTTDGLVQSCSNYIINAMELLQICTKSSIFFHWSALCSVKTMEL